jgi:hypothetical protein
MMIIGIQKATYSTSFRVLGVLSPGPSQNIAHGFALPRDMGFGYAEP